MHLSSLTEKKTLSHPPTQPPSSVLFPSGGVNMAVTGALWFENMWINSKLDKSQILIVESSPEETSNLFGEWAGVICCWFCAFVSRRSSNLLFSSRYLLFCSKYLSFYLSFCFMSCKRIACVDVFRFLAAGSSLSVVLGVDEVEGGFLETAARRWLKALFPLCVNI